MSIAEPKETTADSRSSVQETASPTERAPIVRAENVTKVFPSKRGDVTALHDVQWSMAEGDFVALIGPSGCGKSTLLNMVAGLLSPSAGTVYYDSEPIRSVNTRIAYMTQQDSVFPWRTVLDNVLLPLQLRKVDADSRRDRAQRIIDMVDLSGFEDSYPSQLSGGMRKRVGLAQTLVYDPETVLLDEPFGALDAMLKLALQAELMTMIDSDQTSVSSVLLVTHDLDEAITMADRVVVMSARPGRIKSEVKVDLSRPRDPRTIRDTSEFQEVRRGVWGHLQDEIVIE